MSSELGVGNVDTSLETDGNENELEAEGTSEPAEPCEDTKSDGMKEEYHYSIVEGGTKRGRPKLFDNEGFSYCMRDQRKSRTHWTCSVRGRSNPCPVRIIQIGEKFERRHQHNHSAPKIGASLFGKEKKTPKTKKPVVKRGPRKSSIKPNAENSISCTIVEQGTKRGRPKLFDNAGYSYAMRGKRNNMTFWTCTIRQKGNRCSASITQYGEGEGCAFVVGKNDHNHPSNQDSRKVVEMSVKIKKKAVEEPFKSALQIVKEVYSQDDNEDATIGLPKVSSMAHKASHFRRSCLPKEPQTLDFELAVTSLPSNFLLEDIRVEHHRHVVFATADQLEVLAKATTWYIDSTNMLVKKPFKRLLTFSVFLQKGKAEIQHLPLVYGFMSKQRPQDFNAVLKAVKNKLSSISVTCMVAGFEEGQWKAFEEVFPGVNLRGCAYSFGQGIQEKIKSMGLEEEFSTNLEFHNYVQKLKSLPYLHFDHVVPEFMYLRSQGEDPSIRGLINFIDDTWILNTEWAIPKWTVFKTFIRLKSDCETWMRRIRHKARCGHCHFYHLVGLLHREFQQISSTEHRLVADEELRTIRGSNSKSMQHSLEALWNQCGGLAVGTVFLVEEDTYGSYANLLVKYFIAEAVVTGQSTLFAALETDPDSIVKELPDPISTDPIETGSEGGDSESMKIAWRYQNQPKVQSNQSPVRFGHYYDLTKCMSEEVTARADITTLSTPDFTTSPESSTFMNPCYCKLLQHIQSKIYCGQFGTDQQCDKRNILRIAVQSLGSPLWGENGGVKCDGVTVDQSFHRFLYALRSMLRTAYACCLITVPSHLFQDRGFVDRLERLSDTVVHLESFAGSSKEKNPAYREYHGLLHIRQLPRLNSLGSHMPDTLDLAFKLRRKKFTIEKLHLPPELSETASRDQEDPAPRFKPSSVACGGPSSKLDF